VHAHRPKTGAAARWDATANALFATLDTEGILDRPTDLPGGGQSTPRTMLDALTTDVLVHTWDLARAAGIDPELDPPLCSRAYDGALASGMGAGTEMIAAAVRVARDAPVADRLIALYGRDPGWRPA
jgi:uncharacterized protein (TIGR03086 family)